MVKFFQQDDFMMFDILPKSPTQIPRLSTKKRSATAVTPQTDSFVIPISNEFNRIDPSGLLLKSATLHIKPNKDINDTISREDTI